MLKSKIAAAFRITGSAATQLGDKIHIPPPPQPDALEQRVLPWVAADGDRTLRLDYLLTAESVVVDGGGYEGQWAADIFCKYGCNLYIFEPVEGFATDITRRFSHNKKVKVFDKGLASESRTEQISLLENATSVFKEAEQTVSIQLIDIADFIAKHSITEIDLLKLNIEGGEYEVLERLIEVGLLDKIKNIQVQFHDFAPNAEQRMRVIQTALSTNHTLTYSYPWVWENWQRIQ